LKKPHPYIPNSVPVIKGEMLRAVGAESTDELYAEMIPERLLIKRRMNLPEPLPAEQDLRRHVADLLDMDMTCGDTLSFLGGGCWNHFIPQVCNEIAQRSEFLTAYAGGYYSALNCLEISFLGHSEAIDQPKKEEHIRPKPGPSTGNTSKA